MIRSFATKQLSYKQGISISPILFQGKREINNNEIGSKLEEIRDEIRKLNEEIAKARESYETSERQTYKQREFQFDALYWYIFFPFLTLSLCAVLTRK